MLGKQVLLPKWVVLKNDPAIDLYQSDYKNYIFSSFDESYLTFVKVPTKFLIRQLTFMQKNLINDIGNIRNKILLTIRYSLSGISNYLIETEDSSRLINTVKTRNVPLGQMVEENWLEEVGFNSNLLIELSLLILYFSDLCLFDNVCRTSKGSFINEDIVRVYNISLL